MLFGSSQLLLLSSQNIHKRIFNAAKASGGERQRHLSIYLSILSAIVTLTNFRNSFAPQLSLYFLVLSASI